MVLPVVVVTSGAAQSTQKPSCANGARVFLFVCVAAKRATCSVQRALLHCSQNHPLHKTTIKPNSWATGDCRFGDRCNFAHGEHELRALPPRTQQGGGGGYARGTGPVRLAAVLS
jgi:hypothetical protein